MSDILDTLVPMNLFAGEIKLDTAKAEWAGARRTQHREIGSPLSVLCH